MYMIIYVMFVSLSGSVSISTAVRRHVSYDALCDGHVCASHSTAMWGGVEGGGWGLHFQDDAPGCNVM